MDEAEKLKGPEGLQDKIHFYNTAEKVVFFIVIAFLLVIFLLNVFTEITFYGIYLNRLIFGLIFLAGGFFKIRLYYLHKKIDEESAFLGIEGAILGIIAVFLILSPFFL